MRLLITLLLTLTTTAVAADELTIAGSEWPPYISQQLYGQGVAMVVTEEAFRRAGYTTSSAVDGWPMALDKTINGTYDVITGVWQTNERAEKLLFSEPLLTNYIVLIKRDDSDIVFNERADLDGLRIGIVADYAYSNEPYDTSGIDISESGSARENIIKLRAGDLDLVLADSRVAAYEIDQLIAAKELSIIRKPLATRSLRLAVARANPEHEKIIRAFNQALTAMQADGSYNEILATFRISQ